MGQAYVSFTRNCMDQIRGKVLDELWILTFFEVIKIITTIITIMLFYVLSMFAKKTVKFLSPPSSPPLFLLSSFFFLLNSLYFFLFTLAMVHGANSNAVHVALGKTRP